MESISDSREELRSRRISTEDMVRFQLAEINRLRGDITNPSRVVAWSESLEALADLLIPWAEGDPVFLEQWENRPCRVVRVKSPDGNADEDRFVPFPTAADCREAQRIIMGLLNRAQLLVKRRTISGPGVRQEAKEGQKQAQEQQTQELPDGETLQPVGAL